MNSRFRGASKNMYSGVTTRCFFAPSCGSFELPPTLIGAAEVMGSPCGFVLTSGSRGLLIVASSGSRKIVSEASALQRAYERQRVEPQASTRQADRYESHSR